MMISDGNRIPYTPGSDVALGDVIVQSELIGIATEPIAAGVLGSLAIRGIFRLPKVTFLSNLAAGSVVYWSPSAQAVKTGAGADGIRLGKTIEITGKNATTIIVRVSP